MIDAQLLSDVLAYLQITTPDRITETNILGYIARGMMRLEKVAGGTLDFSAEDMPRALLFDYCRYANAQALEVFEKNFRDALLDLNLERQVKDYEDQNPD